MLNSSSMVMLYYRVFRNFRNTAFMYKLYLDPLFLFWRVVGISLAFVEAFLPSFFNIIDVKFRYLSSSRWNLYKTSSKAEVAKVVYLTVSLHEKCPNTEFSLVRIHAAYYAIFLNIAKTRKKNPIYNCRVFNWCYKLISPNKQEYVRFN